MIHEIVFGRLRNAENKPSDKTKTNTSRKRRRE